MPAASEAKGIEDSEEKINMLEELPSELK